LALERTRLIPRTREFPLSALALGALLIGFTLATVAAHSFGLLTPTRATVVLVVPLLVLGAALRPAWVILFLAAVPVGLINFIPTKGLSLLLLVTLAAQLINRGTVFLGARSGMWSLAAIVVAALVFTADVSPDAALQARGFLNQFIFMILLGITAYNVTRLGDLKGRHLVNALLIGAVATVLLERGNLATSPLDATGTVGGVTSIGRNVAYVATIGFTMAFARSLFREDEDGRPFSPGLHALLAIGFLFVVATSFVRATWIIGLISVLLIARWAGRRRYWLVIPIVLMVIAIVPISRERLLPGSSEGGVQAALSDPIRLTTGRLELWGTLWDDMESELPEGHGYGYAFTLTPERVFGFEDFRQAGSVSAFIYPHNDFIFWTLELGLLGGLALIVFWVQMVRAVSGISRYGSAGRTSVYTLSGILVTMFVVQMVDNSFAIKAVAISFFIAAGYIFGSRAMVHEATPEGSASAP
jgi:hypothetical protein